MSHEVSDPENEGIDSENKTIGDINAITSIANSNKTGPSIGKFGVGFKAVFQYTQTPHIYDTNFMFKIERFIVPMMLNDDFPGRRLDETLFVFPFDHQERNADEAYRDISDKLRHLSFPLLFLTNLNYIEFEFSNVLGLYGKSEHLSLTQNEGDDLFDEELWLFSRIDECERRYSVGFFLNKEGHALSNPKITDEDDTDEDEFMPSAVDYSKKIEQAKQKSAAEIDRITYFEELQNQALSAEKYSYRWFMTLLEMESINIGEANTKSREVSICFAKVERESGTKRTLVLKYPDQYIIYTMVHLDSFVKPETIPYQYKVELL